MILVPRSPFGTWAREEAREEARDRLRGLNPPAPGGGRPAREGAVALVESVLRRNPIRVSPHYTPARPACDLMSASHPDWNDASPLFLSTRPPTAPVGSSSSLRRPWKGRRADRGHRKGFSLDQWYAELLRGL